MKQAERLDNFLLDFRLPVSVKQKYPDRRDSFKDIFRDNTGMGAATDLSLEIRKQLKQSEYLIVICSPNAVESGWVNEEIEYFKSIRGLDYIYPFVVDGIVNANSPNKSRECMPKALRPYKGRAANISTYSFEHAIIEILADILKIEVDEIWQRHVRLEEEKKKQLVEQRDNLLIIQSLFLSEKVNELIEEGDSFKAQMLAIEAIPKDIDNPDRPLIEEARKSLIKAVRCKDITFNIQVNNFCFFNNMQIVTWRDKYKWENNKLTNKCELKYWDLCSGRELKSFSIFGHRFSPDGKKMATIGQQKIDIWNLSELKVQKIVDFTFEGDFQDLVFNCKEQEIAIVSHTKRNQSIKMTITVFNLFTQTKHIIWDALTLKDNKEVLSPNFNYIARQQGRRLCVFITKNTEKVIDVEQPSVPIRLLAFSPDEKYVAIVINEGIIIWNIRTKKKQVITAHIQSFPIVPLTFSTDSISLAYGTDGYLTIRQLTTGNNKSYKIKEKIESLSFSPDGNYIAYHTRSYIKIISINPYTHTCHQSKINCSKYTSTISVSANQKYFVCSDKHNGVSICDVDTGKELYKFHYQKQIIRYATFSPCGRFILAGASDGTISAWTNTGNHISTSSDKHKKKVYHVSFGMNGKRAISISQDGSVILWDIKELKKMTEISLEEPIQYGYVSLNSDCKYIMAVYNKTISIIDVDKKNIIRSWHSDTFFTYALFSPDDRYVVTATVYGKIEVWSTATGKKLEELEKESRSETETIMTMSFNGNRELVVYTLSREDTNEVCKKYTYNLLQYLIDNVNSRFANIKLTDDEKRKYHIIM